MTTLRFVSPERRWRAAFMVVPAALFGWRAYVFIAPVAGYLVGAALLSLAVPIMRTCLIVTDDGLVDRRAFRAVRVPWHRITGFHIERPGGPWGGFCVIADCRDRAHVDLLSTRVYSRAASQDHLDQLSQICWTLEDRLTSRRKGLPPDL